MFKSSTRMGLLAVVLLLAGCATSLRPPYKINEVQVYNQTGVVLKQLRIRDVERNRVFECDNVAPNGICSDRFQPRPYLARPIEVSWSTGSVTRRTLEFVAKVPDFLDPGRPVRGVLVIGRGAGAEAFFEQDANIKD